MSELLDHYNRVNFPYAGILEDLTERTRGQGLSPVEAYASFLDARDNAGLRPYFDYGSTSITTGGHALYMDNIGNVIDANTRTAREMTALLDVQGTLFGKEVVLPVDLGKTGWSQSEYMTYWGLTIAGPDVRSLRSESFGYSRFQDTLANNLEDHGVELDVMNSSNIDREDRRPHYERFVDGFVDTVADLGVDTMQAHRVISLVDPDISLGCSAEKLLADRLEIPCQRVVAMKPATVDEAVPMPTLREDMKVIMAAGGTVLVAARGSMLTLVGE